MQIEALSIPLEGDEEATEQLNRFLRTPNVLSLEKAAVVAQGRWSWSVCVEFLRAAQAQRPLRGQCHSGPFRPLAVQRGVGRNDTLGKDCLRVTWLP